MEQREATYSTIIDPATYNQITTEQHLYIAGSDQIIKRKIREHQQKNPTKVTQVVEMGCGPARLLARVAEIENINLTGFDYDEKFLEFARRAVQTKNVSIVQADASNYTHEGNVDVFYSQGVHHHIAKPPKYLDNVYRQLAEDGILILCDEFLPDYESEEDRRIKTVIWHSHIIANALKNGHHYLAQEEAKILLDDLTTLQDKPGIKTQKQISVVLDTVSEIDKVARDNIELANLKAQEFLTRLSSMYNVDVQGDPTLDLSRGDYKICDSVFRNEVENAGFFVDEVIPLGPIHNVGGMVVYVLRKKL